jgi:hypothetical protein
MKYKREEEGREEEVSSYNILVFSCNYHKCPWRD